MLQSAFLASLSSDANGNILKRPSKKQLSEEKKGKGDCKILSKLIVASSEMRKASVHRNKTQNSLPCDISETRLADSVKILATKTAAVTQELAICNRAKGYQRAS